MIHAPVGTSDSILYDREEGALQRGSCGIPGQPYYCIPAPAALNYEVNAISPRLVEAEGQPSGVFGSRMVTEAPAFAPSGWLLLDLSLGHQGHVLAGGIGEDGRALDLRGRPVNGFMAYDIINANAQPGLLANYSGLFPHRGRVATPTPSHRPARKDARRFEQHRCSQCRTARTRQPRRDCVMHGAFIGKSLQSD